MWSAHCCLLSLLRTKKYIFVLYYIIYLQMSVFSLTLFCTFLFSFVLLWSKTDFFPCPALLYLIYSWELWFLHPGVLIQLVGFYVHIVHCRIMLSDLLHVKIPFEVFFFFFPFVRAWKSISVKIAACLWTHWLIRIFQDLLVILQHSVSESVFVATVSINAKL